MRDHAVAAGAGKFIRIVRKITGNSVDRRLEGRETVHAVFVGHGLLQLRTTCVIQRDCASGSALERAVHRGHAAGDHRIAQDGVLQIDLFTVLRAYATQIETIQQLRRIAVGGDAIACERNEQMIVARDDGRQREAAVFIRDGGVGVQRIGGLQNDGDAGCTKIVFIQTVVVLTVKIQLTGYARGRRYGDVAVFVLLTGKERKLRRDGRMNIRRDQRAFVIGKAEAFVKSDGDGISAGTQLIEGERAVIHRARFVGHGIIDVDERDGDAGEGCFRGGIIRAVHVAVVIHHAVQTACGDGGKRGERQVGGGIKREEFRRIHAAVQQRLGEDAALGQGVLQAVRARQRALEVESAVRLGHGDGGVGYREAVGVEQFDQHVFHAARQDFGSIAGGKQDAAGDRSAAESAAADRFYLLAGSKGNNSGIAVQRGLGDDLIAVHSVNFGRIGENIRVGQAETDGVRRG